MPDMLFLPVPHELFRDVEPEAGELLEKSRYRRRVEFYPDWSYITSPSASPAAVVASLCQAADDVPPGVWRKVIAVHCPVADDLMTRHDVSFDMYNTGRLPVELANPISRAINEALGGYQVVVMFPYADVMEQLDTTLGEDISFH